MTESEILDKEICNQCGKPKRILKKMSLTQWMFSSQACNCDLGSMAVQDSYQFSSVVELCGDCSRPIFTGRAGSMTQWIFSANSCKCAVKDIDGVVPAVDAPAKEDNQVHFRIAQEVSALTLELGLPCDRYQAIRLIGQGAMSKVYECQDRLLQRVVAIKFLVGSIWTGEQILRFQTEAKATSKLTHPNIIKVLDFGSTDEGQPYMVLEYFTGISLQDLIETKGPLPEDAAIEIAIQVADGMRFAHQKKVFHRDLKPANIMLVENEQQTVVAKIIDFGIAEFATDEDLLAKGHTVIGTPNYMSPDLVQGRKFDERSEVYSLACTLFEALTGSPPFDSETALATIGMHVNDKPPMLCDIHPSTIFSGQIQALIDRSLEKDPDDRFADMDEMRSALIDVLADPDRFAIEEEDAADTPSRTSPAAMAGIVLAGCLFLLSVVYLSATLIRVGTTSDTTPRPVVIARSVDPGRYEITTSSPFSHDIPSLVKGDQLLKKYARKKSVKEIFVPKGSDITDAGLEYILHLPLRALSLEGTKITNEGLKKIATIKTLETLNISMNPQLTNYDCLAEMPSLKHIWLTNNEITDKHLAFLKKKPAMQSLAISDNPGITGEGLINLTECKQLHELRMASLQVTRKGIKSLSKLKSVSVVALQFARVQDEDMEALASMPNLNSLNIRGTRISDQGLVKLGKSQSLGFVEVSLCKNVTAEGIARLRQMRKHLKIKTTTEFD